ncbi:hypothetical protein SAMN04488025_10244 [Planifilum fulgidum]|jgi:hypothetical protein|uniref:Uncharacterized protein n=1 Tax=Planifilum fulgidum TaxID=201973 RepID=A0A1I2KIT6_9BACL|nr:hypothetical protein SAMN04488025_10244 [Planifilum fulgidum]
MPLIRLLRKFTGRRREEKIKELVNEVSRELGMEEKRDLRDAGREKGEERDSSE